MLTFQSFGKLRTGSEKSAGIGCEMSSFTVKPAGSRKCDAAEAPLPILRSAIFPKDRPREGEAGRRIS